MNTFYQLGIKGRLTDFAQYLDPNFTWTAPNDLPWGGMHTGAALFRDQVLSSLPDVFDFAAVQLHQRYRRGRPCRRGHQPGCERHRCGDWTVRDGKVTSIWVAYFKPQALLERLGIARGLGH